MTSDSQLSQQILERFQILQANWQHYLSEGRLELFVEFTVAINSLSSYFSSMRLPGLQRLCETLENIALADLGDQTQHPLQPQDITHIQQQIDALLSSINSLQSSTNQLRCENRTQLPSDPVWIKPRRIWIMASAQSQGITDALMRQLEFFGFVTHRSDWCDAQQLQSESAPLAILFIPAQANAQPQELECIRNIRALYHITQLIYLGRQSAIEPMVTLMRAGIDIVIPAEEQPSLLLSFILNLIQSDGQEKSRVLLVEDSQVALTVIKRILLAHDIDVHAINDPTTLIDVLQDYRPDLILMDMYMPHFNGIEATRVLRQMPAYRSLPIVYLSGESEVGMQVEALRLGGDQFLIKPVDPILLAAVVESKIQRFRETQRSSQLDGLTELLNHTTAKSCLQAMVEQIHLHKTITVAMIDIDKFKSINDTYGHPVGDQVIRGLAWLLKGHLRSGDLKGRYGGEEFLIALPGVNEEQACQVLDRIRVDFAKLPHAHATGSLHATFSAGLATYVCGSTGASLTEKADTALLQAKRHGRNRVEISA